MFKLYYLNLKYIFNHSLFRIRNQFRAVSQWVLFLKQFLVFKHLIVITYTITFLWSQSNHTFPRSNIWKFKPNLFQSKSMNLSVLYGVYQPSAILNVSCVWILLRERSHITSSAEGGRGFPKDDGGEGGVYGQMTSSKIAQFRDFLYLKKLFKPNNYAIIYCKQPVFKRNHCSSGDQSHWTYKLYYILLKSCYLIQ